LLAQQENHVVFIGTTPMLGDDGSIESGEYPMKITIVEHILFIQNGK